MSVLRSSLIGAAAFLLALSVRVANAPVAFADGVPQIGVLDDLYHFRRMAFTATHFLRVLDFDASRGERGEFCPWPPLYDFSVGTVAHVFGARSPFELLRWVVWIPPLASALFIGIVAAVVARRIGWGPGAALGVALAASPFLIANSSIGNIDHHFLEAPLAFGILAATCAAVRAKDRQSALISGLWIGAALSAAMFVQSALVIACGVAFVVLLLFSDGLAASIGFSITAIAIVIYRLTRLPNFPDGPWFLGWPYVTLFAAAATASAYWFFQKRRVFAILCGVGVILASPSTPAAILGGSHFFAGERWLGTIVEFQPIWRTNGFWRAAGLSTGAVLVWLLLAASWRRRDVVRGTIALFAIVYLLLTLSSVRFWSVSIPLLALAGTLYAALLPRPFDRVLLLSVALPVLIQYGLWRRSPLEPVIGRRELPWIRAANFLRNQRDGGRVLAPWSLGHVFNVIGERGVILDNFGTMSNEIAFDRAHDAFLALDENAISRYCREVGVRFVVLDNPLYGLQGAAATLGLDRQKFVMTNELGEPIGVTRLAVTTWWWRAYYRRSSRQFRLVYIDPQPSWEGTPVFRGPALMVWERIGR